MATLLDQATEVHRIPLPGLPGSQVTVYLFALRPGTWQYAVTTAAPGWGRWGCDCRSGAIAAPNQFCAVSLALCTVRCYWQGRGVDSLVRAIGEAAEQLWF